MVITLESSSELSPGEDAVVEVEELLPAVDEAVRGGQHQTRPAQAGLQQPAGGVAQLSAVRRRGSAVSCQHPPELSP